MRRKSEPIQPQPNQPNRWPELLIAFPLMLLYCTSIMVPFVHALDLGSGAVELLFINWICLAAWTLAFWNRRAMLATFVIFVLGALALGFLFFFPPGVSGPTPLYATIHEFQYWAAMYLTGFRMSNPVYARWLVMLLCALVCLFCQFFTVKRLNAFLLILSGASFFVALTIIGHTIYLPGFVAFVGAAMLYLLLFRYRKNAAEMTKPTPFLPYFGSVLPLAAVMAAVVILLGFTFKIDPEWMKDIRDKVLRKDTTSVSRPVQGSPGIIVTGDTLGGNLFLDDTVMMVVDSPVGNVHLKATSKDTYTGNSWEQSDKTVRAQALLDDTDETLRALPVFAGDYDALERLFPRSSITIRYAALRTGIIYAPLKTDNVVIDSYNTLGPDTLTLPSSLSEEGLEYLLTYLDPAIGDAEFINLARQSRTGYYATAQPQDVVGQELFTQLNERAYAIRSTYTQLPDDLPQRVRDLAAELTDGLDNDYDKAKAIEQYLSTHYTYTLTPGMPDRNRDFVDQFLFEGKRGYCTYYASAMTVLLRCAGIPSRYVEGYVLPGSRNDSGYYEVTKKQGHAWVEAYFEGIGWLQFEPTSSFTNGPVDPGPSATPSAAPLPTRTPPAETEGALPTDKPTSPGAGLMLPLLLAAACLGAAFLVLYPILARAKMGGVVPRQAAIMLYGQCLKLYALQGHNMLEGETAAQFADRMRETCPPTSQEFPAVTQLFQQARYGGQEPDAGHAKALLAYRKSLLAASRRKIGLFRYLYYRFIWGI